MVGKKWLQFLTVILQRVDEPWKDLHGRVIDKWDEEDDGLGIFARSTSNKTPSSSKESKDAFFLSIGENTSTSTIGTLCNDIASMLYNAGKDLESINSNIVMGFVFSEADDLWVYSANASFPMQKGEYSGC